MSSESGNYIYIVRRGENGVVDRIYRLHVWNETIDFYARFTETWTRSSHNWISLQDASEKKRHKLSITRSFPHKALKEYRHVNG